MGVEDDMFWPENQNAVVARKQNLVKHRQQNDLLAYSVEDLRDRIPAIALINPFATRIVILCKDGAGKVGLKVKAIDKGIFVALVINGSPASMGGMKFGDQILQINGENVAGFSAEKVHGIFKKAGVNNIVLAVRDRPFERTLTLHKDSTGHVGFQFSSGKITAIVVDSSAARNGLLIEHNLLEVNGQNVVGMKDKEISKIIDNAGQVVTVTVIPNFLYRHIIIRRFHSFNVVHDVHYCRLKVRITRIYIACIGRTHRCSWHTYILGNSHEVLLSSSWGSSNGEATAFLGAHVCITITLLLWLVTYAITEFRKWSKGASSTLLAIEKFTFFGTATSKENIDAFPKGNWANASRFRKVFGH